jgi:hypothetical protein
MVVYSLDNAFGSPVNGTTYSTGNSIPEGGTVIFIGPGTAYSHTGLNPSTMYYYKAFSFDPSNTYSIGVTAQANTACGTIAVFPYSQGFENGGAIPSCWTQEQVGGSGLNWTFTTGNGSSSPATAHSGTYNACLKDNSSADNKTMLISPMLNLSGLPDPQLKFWHTQAYWSPDQDLLTVYYRNTPGGTWTLLTTYTANLTSWTEETIALPDASGTYYIAFEGNAKYGYGVCVDDVLVTSTMPFNIALQNISLANGQTACYDAVTTITVAGDGSTFTVQNGAMATMIAGMNILMEPGTVVLPGGYLHGYITTINDFCNQTDQLKNGITAGLTGKAETAAPASLRIYPNPTSGIIRLDLNGFDRNLSASVEIFNMTGNRLQQMVVQCGQLHEFSLAGYPAGIYLVRINAGDTTESIRVIKQ